MEWRKLPPQPSILWGKGWVCDTSDQSHVMGPWFGTAFRGPFLSLCLPSPFLAFLSSFVLVQSYALAHTPAPHKHTRTHC